ncbi:MAG: hypothetical protein DRJ05_15025, partial [Bacteroidetes bacterium]
MKNTLLLIVLSILTGNAFAQNNVGINTAPDPSAVLDISATNQGLLIPRMTETEMNAITSPATSLMVFNTTANAFWYWDGSQWTEFNNGTSLWALSSSTVDLADTNYKVGIGTSNPSGKFEVATINHTGTYGSNLASGGVASASEEFPGQAANLAFDGSTTTYWSNNDHLPAWIGYDLGSGNEKRVARYIVAYNSVVNYDNSPNDWTFEGSDDGNSWIVLDTQTGQGWAATETKTYSFSNTTVYRYYRLNISDNKGVANNFVSVYKMEMKEETLTNQSTFVVNENGSIRIADGNEAYGKVLVSDATGNAAWKDGVTVNGGGWTIDGNLLYNTFDSVGIGTSNPRSELEVAGHIWQTFTGQSVFLGKNAGANDDLTDNNNVFVGFTSGKQNVDGFNNVAVGHQSLFTNTSGNYNIAIGPNALYNTKVDYNIAIGNEALFTNTFGSNNIALGSSALYLNKTGTHNIAIGKSTLHGNTTGSNNYASGEYALNLNKSGSYNIANGFEALRFNSTGNNNIALGMWAMQFNDNGNFNIAIGKMALRYGSPTSCVAIGISA